MQANAFNRLSGRVSGWMVVGLALCAALTLTPSAAGATGADRPAADFVQGWKAGPVARGTGYRTAGGSQRVREVQRSLDRLGYSPGPVDGLFGPRTHSATRRYQSDRELTVDGVVGSQTLASLRARTEAARENTRSERPASSPAGTTAVPASAPVKPQVGRPVSESDGLGGLPSWWMLLLIVPLAFSAAVMAALLLVRAVTLSHAGAAAVRRHALRRRDRDWGDSPAAGAVYIEGRSRDPRVGRFSGIAYWMWPVASGAEPTLLVYDPAKPRPLSVQTDEITSVNGQAIGPSSGRPGPRSYPFRWIGARVHLAERNGVDPLPGTLPVELEVFAEGDRRRWETGKVNGRPLHVRMDDLQAGVERAVMSDRLQDLAAELDRHGMPVEIEELRRLPFGVELTLEVEFALAGREVTRAEAASRP